LENNKNQRLVIYILVTTSAIVILFSIFAPIIFTNSAINSRFDFTKFGGVGDTIGGLMNPFIALAGVLITFLAFYMQYRANSIQIDLFKQNQEQQNELLKEQLFFRLIENLNQRVINFSYSFEQTSNTNNLTSYKALDNLTKLFKTRIDEKCIQLGKQIIAKYPDQVYNTHYRDILRASTMNESPREEDIKELKRNIAQFNVFEERWEYLKSILGGNDNNNIPLNEVLAKIGRVNFYKIPLENRESIYIGSYDEIYDEYGGFLDGYTRNLSYLLEFIDKNADKDFFIDYIKGNLSMQELVIIFYFCASRKSSNRFRNLIKKYSVIQDIYLARKWLIDSPSEEEISKELSSILNTLAK